MHYIQVSDRRHHTIVFPTTEQLVVFEVCVEKNTAAFESFFCKDVYCDDPLWLTAALSDRWDVSLNPIRTYGSKCKYFGNFTTISLSGTAHCIQPPSFSLISWSSCLYRRYLKHLSHVEVLYSLSGTLGRFETITNWTIFHLKSSNFWWKIRPKRKQCLCWWSFSYHTLRETQLLRSGCNDQRVRKYLNHHYIVICWSNLTAGWKRCFLEIGLLCEGDYAILRTNGLPSTYNLDQIS